MALLPVTFVRTPRLARAGTDEHVDAGIHVGFGAMSRYRPPQLIPASRT